MYLIKKELSMLSFHETLFSEFTENVLYLGMYLRQGSYIKILSQS